VVKRRLYHYMDETRNANWPAKLPDITNAINHSPCVSIGDLIPASIVSPLDEPRVRAAKAKLGAKMSGHERNKYFPAPTSFDEMQKMVKGYDENKEPFKKGDFCYLDKVKETMTKGTDRKRGDLIFIVDTVYINKNPRMYKLIDLNFKPVLTRAYGPQLRNVPPSGRPTSEDFYKYVN
jgi:hypothetical protein